MISRDLVAPRDWGEGGQTWELISGPDLSLFHERLAPGSAETAHSHARARQVFFVLEGELEIERAGEGHRLGRHEALEIPPGAVHHVRNVSGAPVEFLVAASPNALGDRTEAP